MVQRDGKPTMVAIRLKLDKDGKIAEAEHLYSAVERPVAEERRNPASRASPARFRRTSALTTIKLIAIGASYYDALDDNDGTKMPFAADCERHENGMITAGPNAGGGMPGAKPPAHPTPHDCAGQISSGVFQYIKTIGNRRVFAADPVTGLVMGLSQFHHPMDFTSYPVKAADGTIVQQKRSEGMFKNRGAVRLARRAHLQGRRRRQGPRDRGDGLRGTDQFAERVGERARPGQHQRAGLASGSVAEDVEKRKKGPSPLEGRGPHFTLAEISHT